MNIQAAGNTGAPTTGTKGVMAQKSGRPVDVTESGSIAKATEVTISDIGRRIAQMSKEGQKPSALRRAEAETAAIEQKKPEFFKEMKRPLRGGEEPTVSMTKIADRLGISQYNPTMGGLTIEELAGEMQKLYRRLKETSKNSPLNQRFANMMKEHLRKSEGNG